MNKYSFKQPDLDEIAAIEGFCLLEFGTAWCSYCNSAQPLISSALSQFSNIRHLKIEDGKGRLLGRSFAVKLWPTFILLKNGVEIKRLVRPVTSDEIILFLEAALEN